MRNLTVRLTALATFLSLAACAEKPLEIPTGQPTFYLSMASRAAKVDTVAARDLISIYRRNNGLSTVALDPLLLAEAQKQADAMAAADSMSHEVRGTLQKRLDGSGLQHSMAVNPYMSQAVRGSRVLLVDDVMTTGSNLTACAQALLEAGAKEVNCLVFARADADSRSQ
jgi:phosphoribosylpyrophosphate synthetase